VSTRWGKEARERGNAANSFSGDTDVFPKKPAVVTADIVVVIVVIVMIDGTARLWGTLKTAHLSHITANRIPQQVSRVHERVRLLIAGTPG
jgi:hypothetical protein